MSEQDDLRQRLRSLRQELEEQPALSAREREDVRALIEAIEDRLRTGGHASHSGLSDRVNLAVERFEVRHPQVSGALHGIGVALANAGI
ncbi:DUF4404 family protein [Streptomyces sp. NPDC006687]|uniref:DUF4404 family protein n=1 Tax=unclassified Streptomyces TaxID=2593676 RepID=UPI0033EEF323